MSDGLYEDRSGLVHQTVRSPEQVALDLPLAGPASRILAYGIDLILIVLIQIILLLTLFLTTPLLEEVADLLAELGEADPEQVEEMLKGGIFLWGVGLLVLLQFLVEWGYFVFWEMVLGGRSPGKTAAGLRVTRDGGLPIGLRESLIRNLLRMVDMLPLNYVVGFVTMLISPKGQRLGDIAAGTVVLRLDRPPPAPLLDDETGEEREHPFRFTREQIERLGSRERQLLRQTLRRLDSLDPEQREAVLERTVEALRTRLGYPEVDRGERVAFMRALLAALRLR